MRLDAILALDPARLKTTYVVRPYIRRNGLWALTSKGGVGKTKLLLDLFVARVTEQPWLGLNVEPGPALFWSGEQGEQEDGRTIQALCRDRGTVHPRHFFELIPDPPLCFGEPAMLARVLARAQEHPGLLVGIDSIRRAFKGEDINSDVGRYLLPRAPAGGRVHRGHAGASAEDDGRSEDDRR